MLHVFYIGHGPPQLVRYSHDLSSHTPCYSDSQGIVAAVRGHGGRFLELDERTGRHDDIGDKKASEKTSQALREGQTQIRRGLYRDETASRRPETEAPPPSGDGEVAAAGYFGYSHRLLAALYRADEEHDARRAQMSGIDPAGEVGAPQPFSGPAPPPERTPSAELYPARAAPLASQAGPPVRPPPGSPPPPRRRWTRAGTGAPDRPRATRRGARPPERRDQRPLPPVGTAAGPGPPRGRRGPHPAVDRGRGAEEREGPREGHRHPEL